MITSPLPRVVRLYYGGADKYCALATCSLAELLDYVLSCPE